MNCCSNLAGKEKTTIFYFPKEKNLQKTWIKFVNRKDWELTNSSFICIKRFEDKYYQRGEGNKQFQLIKILKPVPTIFDPSNPHFHNSSACQVTLLVSVPRKIPRKRVYHEEQYESFIANNVIKNSSEINESLLPLEYSF